MAKTSINSQDVRDLNIATADIAASAVTLAKLGALTNKGDLLTSTGASVHVAFPVGVSNGMVLSVNSAQATGLEWVAGGAGSVTSVTGGVGITENVTTPNPNLDLDINSLTTGGVFETGDLLAFVDVSLGGTAIANQRKLTVDNLRTFLTHNLLSTSHGDTTAASAVTGDLIVASTAGTPKWERFGIGATVGGLFLTQGAGALPLWATDATWNSSKLVLGVQAPAGHTNANLQVSTNGATAFEVLGTAAPFYQIFRAGGTLAAPTVFATGSGVNAGSIYFGGYDGSNYGIGAEITVKSTQTWTTSAYGSRFQFLVANTGSTVVTETFSIDGTHVDIKDAKELRFYESGSVNYSAFKATTQAVDITYTLPVQIATPSAVGTSIGALSTTTAGTLTWVAYQPLDTGLTSLSTQGIGFIVSDGADTFATRTLVAPAAGITISNTTGAGNPTWALANDLAALEGLSGIGGFAARTAADTWFLRQITVNGLLSITNPLGILGDPLIDWPDNPTIIGGVSTPSKLTIPLGNTAVQDSSIALTRAGTTSNSGPVIRISRAKGDIGSETTVANNDLLGRIIWDGYEATTPSYRQAARIEAVVDDATPSATSMGAKLSFYTVPAGSLTTALRFEISNAGRVTVAGSGFGVNGLAYIWPGSGAANTVLKTDGAGTPTLSWAQVAYTEITGTPSSLPPSGAAGGDLAGSTYPAPIITTGVVTNAKLFAMPAHSVKVNNTSLSGVPVDLVLATNTVVGRLTGGVVRDLGLAASVTNTWNTAGVTTISVESTAFVGGDVTAPANSVLLTLNTVNANVGTFGSATQVGQFTVNAKGLITAAANVAISGGGFDINALTADTPVTGDFFPFYDVSGADQNKVTIDNLAAAINVLTDPFSQYVKIAGRTTTTNDFTISTSGATGGTIIGSSVAGAPLRIFGNAVSLTTASAGQVIINPTVTGLPTGTNVGGITIPLAGLSFGSSSAISALAVGAGAELWLNTTDGSAAHNLLWFNPLIRVSPAGNARLFGRVAGLVLEHNFQSNSTVANNYNINESNAVRHVPTLSQVSTLGSNTVTLVEMTDVYSRPTLDSTGTLITTRRGLYYRNAVTTPASVATSVVIDIEDTNAGTTNIAMRSLIAAGSAGGAKRNLLFTGDAPSMMAGTLKIGSTASAATQMLEVFGNVLIQPVAAAAQELRLAIPAGTIYTAFKAKAQGGNITYTLPDQIATASAIGTSIGALSTTTGGALTWVAYQPADADLTTIAALSGTGFLVHTGAGTWAERSLDFPAGFGIDIQDPDGVGANPSISLDINSMTPLTTLADLDSFPIFDDSAITNKKTSMADVITYLAAKTDPFGKYTLLLGRAAAGNDTILSTTTTGGGTLTGSTVAGAPLILNATSDTVLFPIQLQKTATSTQSALRGVLQFAGTGLDFPASGLMAAYIVGRINNTVQTWTFSGAPAGGNLFFFGPRLTNFTIDDTLAGGAWNALLFNPDFRITSTATGALTVTSTAGMNNQVVLSRSGSTGAVVITNTYGLRDLPTVAAGCTITTRTGVSFPAMIGAGTQTNVYGMDFADQTGGTVAAVIRSSLTAAAAKFFLKDEGGAQSAFAGKFTTYNNLATAGAGMTSIAAVINTTAQSAALTTAALWTPLAAGFYRISFTITQTQQATTSCIMGAGVNVNYTTGDGAAAKVQNVPMWLVGATTATTDLGEATNAVGTTLIGSIVIYSSTTAATYDVGYTSVGGTAMQYIVRIRVEAL